MEASPVDKGALLTMTNEQYEEAKKQAKYNFQLLLPILENAVGRPAFSDINEEYNIGCFHIDQLDLSDAKNFHKEVMEKCRNRNPKRTWCQNELRLFVWLLFHFEHAVKKQISEFTNEQWSMLARIFIKKDVEDCKFQWLALTKSSLNGQPWKPEEDQLLTEIIKNNESEGRWNQIAKDLFKFSNGKIFRKPKQCRERWRNYLDESINKGDWTHEQDCRLMEFALELGKKWSAIAKCMRNRTEHAVKNRYQSLLKKYKKSNKKDWSRLKKSEVKKGEIQIVREICKLYSQENASSNEKIERQMEQQPKEEQLPAEELRPAEDFKIDAMATMPTPSVSWPIQNDALWVFSPMNQLRPIGFTDYTGRWVIPSPFSPVGGYFQPNCTFTTMSDWQRNNGSLF